MKIFALLAPAALGLALVACDDSATSVVCPGLAGPSLVVSVVDAQTGLSVTGLASGTWSMGTFSDSLRHYPQPGGDTVLAAFGPPGVYEVRVVRPGHADWVRTGVEVAEGRCGPARADVTATLTAVHQSITF
jgi:hypothetical protein